MNPELFSKLTEAKGKNYKDLSEAKKDIDVIYEQTISRFIKPSPLYYSSYLSQLINGDVWLKLESLNPTGAFKVRGALNAVAKLREQFPNEKLKICAASAGNHAQGVAYAARELDCEAHVFLPKSVPLIKKNGTEKLGAHVYLVGDNLEETFEAALAFSKKERAEFLHAFNDFNVILGQATIAYEIYQQLTQLTQGKYMLPDIFICSVGGGGLLAGCSIYFKSLSNEIKIIGVEQDSYDSAKRSLERHKLTPIEKKQATIADGITVAMIGNLNYDYMVKYVDAISTVNDNYIIQAILALCEQDRVLAEGAGAAAVADLIRRPEFYAGKRVIACISGGNIDPQLLTSLFTQELFKNKRL